MWVSNLQTSAVMTVYQLMQAVIKLTSYFACTRLLLQASAFSSVTVKLCSYGRRIEAHLQ